MGFLPISKQDMDARGWTQCDFVYVIVDAYVDHPSFGHAIISRVLEKAGGAVVFTEGNFNEETLLNEIKLLLGDRERLKKMSEAMLSLAVPEAADRICDIILDIARKNKKRT